MACSRRERQLPPLKPFRSSKSGADVEWILNGTGSLSVGSARARSHRPSNSRGNIDSSSSSIKVGNPWTDRRPSEMLAVGVGVCRIPQEQSVFGTDMNDQRSWESPMWSTELTDSGNTFLHNAPQGFSVLPSRLASLSFLERPTVDGAQETTTWTPPERGSHSPRVLTPTRNRRRILEPITSPVHHADGRGTTPVRKNSSNECRLKMPSITSPSSSQDRLRDSDPIATVDLERTQIEMTPVRFVTGSENKNVRPKFRRRTRVQPHDRTTVSYHPPIRGYPFLPPEELDSPTKGTSPPTAVCSIPQRPLLARRENPNGPRPDSSHLPSTNGQDQCVPPVDSTSEGKQPSDDLDFTSVVDEEPNLLEDKSSTLEAEDRERAQKYLKLKEVEDEFISQEVSPVTNSEVMEVKEVKESVEFVQNSKTSSLDQIQNGVNSSANNEAEKEITQEENNPPPVTRKLNRRNQLAAKVVRQRPSLQNRSRVVPISTNVRVFPDTLKPVEKPKEILTQFFLQMEQLEWEMTMQGLTLLVRLVRHHADVLLTQLHSIVVSVVQQVRNLRSQVARAACQTCGELFLAFKRNLDHELEDLTCALLNRTADTNKFLRADSNAALDLMLENCSPMKILQIVVTRGVSHQNAIVRAVAARLLVCLTNKMGPEKVLSLPRDMRDKILLTGANFLMEGSLETRNYGKEFFRMMMKQPNFSKILLDAIPQYILRNINKTLKNL